ncbi:unnamed protein product [Cercospora beticola]|nr:unnamed protein product [Cercospora beticola]
MARQECHERKYTFNKADERQQCAPPALCWIEPTPPELSSRVCTPQLLLKRVGATASCALSLAAAPPNFCWFELPSSATSLTQPSARDNDHQQVLLAITFGIIATLLAAFTLIIAYLQLRRHARHLRDPEVNQVEAGIELSNATYVILHIMLQSCHLY